MEPGASCRLAAKFRPSATEEARYHPLSCHMADVAAVALALWDGCLPDPVKKGLSSGLGLPEDEARRWAAFLAGLHDLGKACPAFQLKDPASGARLRGLLPLPGDGAKYEGRRRPPGTPGHGSVSGNAVARLLPALGVGRYEADKLALILAGHHGIFPGDILKAKDGAIGEPPSVVRAWGDVRKGLFDEFAALLGIPSLGRPDRLLSNSEAMLLAGLISVADWIGSREESFAWSEEGAADLPAYFEQSARKQAEEALTALHWRALPDLGGTRTFGELFATNGRPLQPRPLQQAAQDALATATGGLVIIEAPMGEGKTEAALLFADYWNATGAARGTYIALPTQATSNQLHGRVADFLRCRFEAERAAGEDVNLLLVHGGAGLLDDVVFLPGDVDADAQNPREGQVAAGEWFLPRKRSLLAPYGVGTIDQALMAVLQVKHVFVRLFGLAGKVVVIDEVHAYDTYMTELLECLLEWLAALGSPVVLLSATLPAERRRGLMEAYRRGRRESLDDVAPTLPQLDTAYPRISWLGGEGLREEHFEAAECSKRTLDITPLRERDESSHEQLIALLESELASGGCAAVICNTVKRAQETYAALREAGFLLGSELGLFHARFLLRDRQASERKCLRRFGPPPENPGRKNGRPHRYVLVATQVVEQSLDLDFDVMVTDFAPIDLLLQRSGRLQRHQRERARDFSTTLHARWPNEDSGVPAFDGGTKAVYDEHILLRTWHALRQHGPAIAIPGDLQHLVDAVYDSRAPAPQGADAALVEKWDATRAKMDGKQKAEQTEAQLRRLRTPVGPGSLTSFLRDPREEDDPELHPALQALTRFTERTVSVVLLSEGSPLIPKGAVAPDRETVRVLFGRSVSVSSWPGVDALFEQEPPPAFAASAALRRHRLLILDSNGEARLGGVLFRYDSTLGLTITREGGQ